MQSLIHNPLRTGVKLETIQTWDDMFKVPCTLLVRISVEKDGISGQRCIPHRRDPSGDGPTSHRPYLLCNSPFPFSCSARNSYISLTNACLGLFMFFSMSSALLQEDSHNNIAPGFALLHVPFFFENPLLLQIWLRRTWAFATRMYAFCTTSILDRKSPWRPWTVQCSKNQLWYIVVKNGQNESLESRGSVQWPRFWYILIIASIPISISAGSATSQVEPAKSPTRVNILQQLNP